ncbi:MAG: adenylyl-sulfate kinase [Nitrospirae bacterium]|nr:adenylyl-sulfate kinase [Nitrospirota bacterium]
MPWVIWITGLPGCGKSTAALALKERVKDAVILQADALRKFMTPNPDYSEEEREHVYRVLVFTAKNLNELGHNVIIDATGNRRKWRELAKREIPEFYEVYLKCPIEICVERERARIETHGAPKGIYEKAGRGAPVPGVNAPYEEPLQPDLVIDTEKTTPHEAAERILNLLK